MIPELLIVVSIARGPDPVELHPTGPLDVIAQCESGGRNVMNYMHSSNPSYYTAGGYFQITNGTWRDFGGTEFAATAIQASYSQQKTVAERIYKARGTSPWSASEGCWGGKLSSSAPVITEKKHSSDKVAKSQTAKPKHSKTVTVQPGDTLSDIAQAHGTTWQDLYSKNTHLTSPHLIHPGDTLFL